MVENKFEKWNRNDLEEEIKKLRERKKDGLYSGKLKCLRQRLFK